ncbi:MAG: two-component regulator propeller domain-containing protein, partial [Prevotella sp.]
MKLKTIILIFIISTAESLFAIDLDKMALSSRRITSADGLSGNTVYDIVQDSDGFIWMGAAYGLCRYDGYSFVNYYSFGSDATRKIEANTGNLYLDEENKLLWIHTSTFTFACYNTMTGRFIDYTGRGDETRPYRRFLRAGNDLWLYDTQSGVRKVTCRDGSFECTDYTLENGLLPSNNVPRIVEDGERNIWIMTSCGLAVVDTTGKARTVVKDRKYYAGNSYNGNVLCLSEGNIVEMYAPNGRRTKHTEIPAKYGKVKVIRSNFVWHDKWLIFSGETFCIDLKRWTADLTEEYKVSNGLLLDSADGYFFESNNSGDLWIFAPDGSVERLPLIENTSITAERRRKFTIRRGPDGLFYIASYGNGLFVYNPKNKALRHFSASDTQPVIDSDFLMGLYIDRNGNLWVAQDAGGVSLIAVSSMSVADFILPAPQHRGDWANWVRMAAQRPQGDIVVATKDNKMHTIDIGTGEVTSTATTKACAFAYMTDTEGHTWIATRGDGIYVDDTHYNKYDKEHHVLTNDFYDMKMDTRGRVWLASYENGLFMTRYNNGGKLVFKQYLDRSLNERRLHLLEIDSENRLWIASSNGLYVVYTKLDEITDNDFKCFNTTNGLFPFDELRGLKYADGYLWAGGRGGGLVRCKVAERTQGKRRDITLENIRMLTARQGLADNSVNAIASDRFGNIWAATESGLSRIYDSDMKVKTFMFGNDPGRNCYSDGCAMQLSDGRLIFGTRYGMTVITPKKNYDSERNAASDVCITDMKINGISVCDSNTLEKTVNNLHTIRLKHNENTISLSFSNFEYADIESSLYQYYLDGSDASWRAMTSVNH